MDRSVFKEELSDASAFLNTDKISENLQACIDLYGAEHVKYIAIQEMAELTKELTDDLREKPDEDGILEELADVACSIEYLKLVYGISDEYLAAAMNVKVDNVYRKISRREFK